MRARVRSCAFSPSRDRTRGRSAVRAIRRRLHFARMRDKTYVAAEAPMSITRLRVMVFLSYATAIGLACTGDDPDMTPSDGDGGPGSDGGPGTRDGDPSSPPASVPGRLLFHNQDLREGFAE